MLTTEHEPFGGKLQTYRPVVIQVLGVCSGRVSH